MQCPNCNQPVRDVERFCRYCGTNLGEVKQAAPTFAQDEAPATPVLIQEWPPIFLEIDQTPQREENEELQGSACSLCGAVLWEGIKFCNACGAALEQLAVEPEPLAEPLHLPSATNKNNSDEREAILMEFCRKCGAQLEDGMKFCGTCGHPTNLSTPAVQVYRPQVLGNANVAAWDQRRLTVDFHPEPGETLVSAHIREYASTLGQFSGYKYFDGLATDILVSPNGYIGIYYPWRPAVQKGFLQLEAPEQEEHLEVFHISQISRVALDVQEETQMKQKKGLGGAVVGGVLGGATGAVIGSAVTGGKIKQTTKLKGIDLVLDVKDFDNPRRVFKLWDGDWTWRPASDAVDERFKALKNAYTQRGDKQRFKDNYGAYRINPIMTRDDRVALAESLESTISQMLSAYTVAGAASASQPAPSVADELAKFKALLDCGALTQQEFDEKKRQLLGL